MTGGAQPFSGGSTGGDSDAPPVAASMRSSDQTRRQLVIPDTLRPATVGAFAPYRIRLYDLTGAERGRLLDPDPYRVGLLVTVALLVSGSVRLYVDNGPEDHDILWVGSGETKGGMLADLFSLVMAGWNYDSPGACRITVADFSRSYVGM